MTVVEPALTRDEQAILRRCAPARRTRERFPVGCRVHVRNFNRRGEVVALSTTGGIVRRHVPLTDAQGGLLVITWDSGVTASHSPVNLQREDQRS